MLRDQHYEFRFVHFRLERQCNLHEVHNWKESLKWCWMDPKTNVVPQLLEKLELIGEPHPTNIKIEESKINFDKNYS